MHNVSVADEIQSVILAHNKLHYCLKKFQRIIEIQPSLFYAATWRDRSGIWVRGLECTAQLPTLYPPPPRIQRSSSEKLLKE